MKSRIQKVKDNLIVSIPDNFATEIGLGANSVVEISLVDGKLIIEPVLESPLSLYDLLAHININNLHREIETQPPIGNEAW